MVRSASTPLAESTVEREGMKRIELTAQEVYRLGNAHSDLARSRDALEAAHGAYKRAQAITGEELLKVTRRAGLSDEDVSATSLGVVYRDDGVFLEEEMPPRESQEGPGPAAPPVDAEEASK